MSHRRHEDGIFMGLLFLLVGGILLGNQLELFPEHISLHDWWPLILVALGLNALVKNRNIFDFGGLFLILLGGAFFCIVRGLYGLTWSNVWQFWPVILILLGLSMLFRPAESEFCAAAPAVSTPPAPATPTIILPVSAAKDE